MPALLDTLASYVPLLIRRRLAALAPVTAPSREAFPAAVLLADISGFTALAERLARDGAGGSEALSRLLNTFFGQLIAIISAHGGDIVKFAGDAMLAVWSADDEPLGLKAVALQQAVRRAAGCALAMQAQAAVEVQGTRLSLRVGIGAGEVVAVQLGGERSRWELVLAGEPLAQMSLAKREARPGEVILSPQAASLYQSSNAPGEPAAPLHLQPPALPPALPLPAQSLDLPASAEAALKAYIPAAVVARLAAGQGGAGDWLAELRRVTVLFVNLAGLDHTLPIAQAQALMRAIQETLYYFEGSINKLSVDDKGVTLLAAFGLPPLAHEDDAARGVQAALQIQSTLSRLGFGACALGMATGRAFCGAIGSDARREYTMIGDVVNLAARLTELAGGAVLCDPATYHAASAEVMFESLPPVGLRGKSGLVPVYKPLRAHPSAPSRLNPAQIFGRRSERELLQSRLRALQAGESSLVLIEGEAGIGKSRLVGELLDQAQALALRALLGGGDAIEKTNPYHAWRAVVNEVFGLSAAADTNTQRGRVLALLDRDPGSLALAPLLNTLLPLDLIDNDLTEAMAGQVRAENLRALLLQILRLHTGGAPLLLVIEDAQWLDSASWSLALSAVQNIQPLLLVLAARPLADPFPAEYTQLLYAPRLYRLALDSLPPADIAALICQRLRVQALPEGVLSLIQARAEGHPFFSEELAYALRDSGVIVIEGGQCRLAGDVDLDAIHFPDTIQGAIISRIDRLPPALQLTLKTASVLGRTFTHRLLRDIHPIEADRPLLNDHLGALARLDITPLESIEPELIYRFKHVITHEVAYDLLLFAQRQQLHRAAAEWHEARYAEDLSPFYPLVAHHWSRALGQGAPDPYALAKALEYLGRAGEQALSSFANREAAQFFADAIRLVPRSQASFSIQRRARWERMLGEAYFRLGQLSEGRAHIEQALALHGRPAPASRTWMALGLAGAVVRQALRRALPVRPWPAADVNAALEQVRALERLGEIAYYASDALYGLYAVLRDLNLAESAGPSPELARAYANMCVAANIVSLHRLADAYARRAQETAESLNDLTAIMSVLNTTSVHTISTGQWPLGQAALERAREIAERIGDRRIADGSLAGLAHIAHHQGEFRASLTLWRDLSESAHRYNNPQTQAWGLLGQAENRLRLGGGGDVAEAVAMLGQARALLARGAERAEEARALGSLALAQVRLGETTAARESVAQAVGLMRQFQLASYGIFSGYFNIEEAILALAEAEPAGSGRAALLDLSKEANAALARYANSFPIGRPRALLWQGLDSCLRGDMTAAHRAWQRALGAAEKLNMSYEIARAEYEIGRRAAGAQRAGRLARARSLFESCGAQWEEAQVEKLGAL